MKSAIIHDHFAQDGGAERVARALLSLFPESPVFTIVHDKKIFDDENFNQNVKTSFIQKIPLGVRKYQWFLSIMPTATESYNLNDYNLLISSSSIFSKGIITPPNATHICYCHTPPRFLWTDCHNYLKELKQNFFIKKFIPFFLTNLRMWDKLAAERVDYFIANSLEVQKRIKKYYNRESIVIHPPVETSKFRISESIGDYFLAGGRMVGYKRFDLIVKAFNRLNIPLKIFGGGPLLKILKSSARPNIQFLGKISEENKIKIFSRCRAFLNPQFEDFGITAIEAMASGRPVIAYRSGGALETVVEGKTGTFFEEQTWEDLADKILRFDNKNYNPAEIKKHAEQFDISVFNEKILEFVGSIYPDTNKSIS
ncbi:glycosyltransferase [Patescibacteria group bacterium]|nr:glycosyltransferase [Patescibacteria group bacterium]